MKIIPAILADNCDDFDRMIQQAESFTDYVQIDMMDGDFVPSVSFAPEKLNHLRTSLSFEVHLMVKHPSAYISGIENPGLKKVIFHFEADVKHDDFIDQMKKRGLSVGMAVKPETELKAFEKVVEQDGFAAFPYRFSRRLRKPFQTGSDGQNPEDPAYV